MKIFKQRILFCQKAILWELGKRKFQQEVFEKELSHLNFSIRLQIFFRKLMIRRWISQKKWKKALRSCNLFLHRYPWISSFYQLRAFVMFHEGRLEEAVTETLRATKLDPSNFIALENITGLLLKNPVQFEYRLILRLISNYQRQNSLEVHSFYPRFLKSYLHALWKTSQVKSQVLSYKNWKKVVNFALKNQSLDSHILMGKMLSFRNVKLRSYLKEFLTFSKGKERKRVLKIISYLEEQRRYFEKQKIKQILIRYSALAQRLYVFQIRNMGAKGIARLFEVLQDKKEQEILRFLAAEMLMKLCDIRVFEKMMDIVDQGDVHAHLLAQFAMRQKGIFLPWRSSALDKIPHLSSFYKILYAFFEKNEAHRNRLRGLLYDKNPWVSIAAAYNLRRITRQRPVLNEVTQKFLLLMSSSNPGVRDFAVQGFWKNDARKLPSERDKGQFYLKYMQGGKYFAKYLRRYGHLLLQSSKDTIQVRKTVLRVLLSNYGSLLYLNGNPLLSMIKVQLKDMRQNEFFEHHATIALAFMSDFGEIIELLNQKSSFWLFKFFVFRYSCFQIKNVVKLVFSLEKFFSAPCKNLGDRMLKQMMLVYSMNFLNMASDKRAFILFYNTISKCLHQNLKNKNEYLRKAAIVASAWGKSENIKRINPYLESTDSYTQKAAFGTLATLLLKHDKEKLSNLNRRLKKMPKSFRKNVAWQYYYSDKKESIVHVSFLIHSNQSTYDFGKVYLYKEACRLKEKKLHKIFSLQKAIDIYPHSDFFYESARTFCKKEKWKKAKSMLKKSLEFAQKENDSTLEYKKNRAMGLLANIYFSQKNYGKSLFYLKKLEKVNPFDYDLQMHLGYAYSLMGESSKSWKYYSKAYLCQPQKIRDSLFDSWKASDLKKFSKKENLKKPNEKSLLFAMAYYYLRNKDRHRCINIFKIIREFIHLPRNFFESGVFHHLFDHPWVQSLPR